MSTAISWSFGELEAVLAEVHSIDQTKRTAFQARLKNFHRLNFPIGFHSLKGKASAYSPSQVIDMALAIEMTQLGLPPERTAVVLGTNRWPTLMAVQIAARSLLKDDPSFGVDVACGDGPLPMFIYFDPAALGPLTLHMPAWQVPDMDRATNSFFYGGIGIVRESIQHWTSGGVSRISLINVTASMKSVVTGLYPTNTKEHLELRSRFLGQLTEEADAIVRDWEGGSEAEADHVFGLLEREPSLDPAELAGRLSITVERAAFYISEASKGQIGEGDDSNPQT